MLKGAVIRDKILQLEEEGGGAAKVESRRINSRDSPCMHQRQGTESFVNMKTASLMAKRKGFMNTSLSTLPLMELSRIWRSPTMLFSKDGASGNPNNMETCQSSSVIPAICSG